jgi:hypothetical protein
MISERRFLNLLERAAAELPAVAVVALTETVSAVAVEARAMIGHEHSIWPPLAESTVEEKERLGYTGHESATDPLLRTGKLRDSIEFSVDAVSLTGAVGSDDPVALYQELGTSRIPPRPFIKAAMMGSQPQAELFFGRALESVLTPKRP